MPSPDRHEHDQDTPPGGQDTHDHVPSRVRGPDGKYASTIDNATRDAAAVALRSQGHGYGEIARLLGWSDRSGARKAVERALSRVPAEAVAELRQVEDVHLDALRQRAWQVMETPGPIVSDGRVVKGPGGEPLEDQNTRLRAIDRLARVSDAKAKLWGLNAPAVHRIENTTVLDEEIAALLVQHEATAREDERKRLAGPDGTAQ
jgi:hypothetical protein